MGEVTTIITTQLKNYYYVLFQLLFQLLRRILDKEAHHELAQSRAITSL